MKPETLSGLWTYRSFRNAPALVADFNDIRLAQTDLRLNFGADGRISGAPCFPAGVPESEQGFMDIEGHVIGQDPLRVQFRGKGRVGTRSEEYEYAYDGILSPSMLGATDQRPVLTGTVMRVRARGGDKPAAAGMTATFAAVRQDN